jgi:hypothetical protein
MEAPENGKEWSHSAHDNGMNEEVKVAICEQKCQPSGLTEEETHYHLNKPIPCAYCNCVLIDSTINLVSPTGFLSLSGCQRKSVKSSEPETRRSSPLAQTASYLFSAFSCNSLSVTTKYKLRTRN